MARNKRQKRITDIQSAQQHIVMLHEPYPLIYNEETGEPAIQIGTLNIVETKDDEIEVESYPIIRPIILNDENGEINGSGIISPYSMYIAESGSDMSGWRNMCILTPHIDIEDLFMLLQEYCNLADTMIQDPADIIEGLKAYGYKVNMPKAKEIVIHLEPDDSRIWWKSEYPTVGGPVDRHHRDVLQVSDKVLRIDPGSGDQGSETVVGGSVLISGDHEGRGQRIIFVVSVCHDHLMRADRQLAIGDSPVRVGSFGSIDCKGWLEICRQACEGDCSGSIRDVHIPHGHGRFRIGRNDYISDQCGISVCIDAYCIVARVQCAVCVEGIEPVDRGTVFAPIRDLTAVQRDLDLVRMAVFDIKVDPWQGTDRSCTIRDDHGVHFALILHPVISLTGVVRINRELIRTIQFVRRQRARIKFAPGRSFGIDLKRDHIG